MCSLYFSMLRAILQIMATGPSRNVPSYPQPRAVPARSERQRNGCIGAEERWP